ASNERNFAAVVVRDTFVARVRYPSMGRFGRIPVRGSTSRAASSRANRVRSAAPAASKRISLMCHRLLDEPDASGNIVLAVAVECGRGKVGLDDPTVREDPHADLLGRGRDPAGADQEPDELPQSCGGVS